MNKVKKWILNWLLKKPRPAKIPRDGESGKQINCYIIRIYERDAPIIEVNSIESNGITGNYFEGIRFHTEVIIPFSLYPGLHLRIYHYHGLVTHIYKGVWDYIFHEWTQFYKLQSIYTIVKHPASQYFFNKKSLQLPQRMKILENIIEKQYEDEEPNTGFWSSGIMAYMYSTKFFLHPQKEEMLKKMDLYLSSFKASGELEYNDDGFIITEKAIVTLEKYQIETARAKSAKSINKWILSLTVILTFFSAFQSGLIVSPVWIDLG